LFRVRDLLDKNQDKSLLNKFVLLQQMLLDKNLNKVTNRAPNLVTNLNKPVPSPGVRAEAIAKKPPPAAAACCATAAAVAQPSTAMAHCSRRTVFGRVIITA
jgi:hypothetical protein